MILNILNDRIIVCFTQRWGEKKGCIPKLFLCKISRLKPFLTFAKEK